MRIIATEELSISQQREVEALEAVVRKEEGLQSRLFLSNRLNCDPRLPCFFLAYLSSTWSAPSSPSPPKGGGIHRLHRLRPSQQGLLLLLVIREPAHYATAPFTGYQSKRPDWGRRTRHAASDIERSEYLMALGRDDYKPTPQNGTLVPITRINAEDAAYLMSRIFESDLQRSRDRISLMLLEEGRRVFAYQRRGITVGVLNAQRQGPSTFMIYGVGILEEHRSNGYGKAMMSLALTTLFADADTVHLEVESTNEHALALYTALGFRPVMQMDYHRLALR